eukprot:COSAG01_NODE_1807_length_9189_cov_24.677778_4_plen_53_part_00
MPLECVHVLLPLHQDGSEPWPTPASVLPAIAMTMTPVMRGQAGEVGGERINR